MVFTEPVRPQRKLGQRPIRLLANPLTVELFAHIRRATLIPEFEEADRLRDFEIPGMCGEARASIDCAAVDQAFRIEPLATRYPPLKDRFKKSVHVPKL